VRNRATPDFWDCYNKLPAGIQRTADRKFELFKKNPKHPSFNFHFVHGEDERIARVKITRYYRAEAIVEGETYTWFYIGPHDRH